MFPFDTLLVYIAACAVVVMSPGPDNILAISRGLSQGKLAAALSALGAGLTFIAAGLSVLTFKQRSAL